jgi:hypothetical protein
MCPKDDQLLLIVRSEQSLFATDTAANFHVQLPGNIFPDEPFWLRLESVLVMPTVGDVPYAREIQTSLGRRASYDTRSTGTSNHLGYHSVFGTGGRSAPILCYGPGRLSEVNFRMVEADGSITPNIASMSITLSIRKIMAA